MVFWVSDGMVFPTRWVARTPFFSTQIWFFASSLIFHAAPTEVNWLENNCFFPCDRIFTKTQLTRKVSIGNFWKLLDISGIVPQEISELKQVLPHLLSQLKSWMWSSWWSYIDVVGRQSEKSVTLMEPNPLIVVIFWEDHLSQTNVGWAVSMVGDDNYSHRRFILNWSLSHWLELQSISMVRIRISDEQYPVVPTGAKHQVRKADELQSNESSLSE